MLIKNIITTLLICSLSAALHAENLIIDEYRENLRSSPSGSRIGVLHQGTRVNTLQEQGDWLKVSVEGWVWRGSTRKQQTSNKQAGQPKDTKAVSALNILVPELLKKGYSKEDLEEMVWFDVAFDTSNLPAKSRAIKGALIISDLFDEVIMRIYWTINKPLSPGEEYVEKGTNFAYNEFLNHHQWVRFTEKEDMKVSFEVRNIIFEDGSRKSYFR